MMVIRGPASFAIAVMMAGTLGLPVAAADAPADLCFEVAEGAIDTAAWASVREAVSQVVGARTALFPDPTIVEAPLSRLDVASGHAGLPATAAACLEPGSDWTARLGREFLEAGADRMLAEAPTTPGIASDVTLEWYPDESRLRTTLVFAGPLDIPNGTCWVDDRLSVDPATGTAVASGEQGVETSPFAEGACGRFFDDLPDGGAGAQAVTMMPATVELAAGTLMLVVRSVIVRDDAVVLSGSLELD